MFLSCRPFVVITLSTGLVGVEVIKISILEEIESLKNSTIMNMLSDVSPGKNNPILQKVLTVTNQVSYNEDVSAENIIIMKINQF